MHEIFMANGCNGVQNHAQVVGLLTQILTDYRYGSIAYINGTESTRGFYLYKKARLIRQLIRCFYKRGNMHAKIS